MSTKNKVYPTETNDEFETRILSPNSMIMQVFDSSSTVKNEEKEEQIKKNSQSNRQLEKILKSVEKWDLKEFLSIYEFENLSPDSLFDYKLEETLKVSSNFLSYLDNCNLLHYAALYRATRIVRVLLSSQFNYPVDSMTKEGITPLHISAAVGDFYTVRELLTHGANKNLLDQFRDFHNHFYTPWLLPFLMQLDLSNLLFVKTTNLSWHFSQVILCESEKGRIALHYAVCSNVETCIILTSDGNYDLQLQDENEKSPLQYGKMEDKPFIAKYLETLDKKKLNLWIPQNICQFECYSIIPRKESLIQCECGQNVADHHSVFEKYDFVDTENVEKPTNFFGEIEFSGLYKSKPYVRMSINTKFETTASLLIDQWKITKPSLIISIYGSDFEGHAIKDILKKGILKSAGNRETFVWIITDGIFTNLIEVIGKAIRDFTDAYGENQMYGFAITPWSIHNETEYLCSKDYQGTHPAEYNKISSKATKSQKFDQNHSHYIFVDIPRTEDTMKSFIDYRLTFENQVSKLNEFLANTKMNFEKVPLCGILVSGNRDDLKLLHGSLVKNGKPTVIIKGSGGLANIIGELVYEMKEKNRKKKSFEEIMQKEYLKMIMTEIWEISDEYEEEVIMIQEIIENRHLIEIYSVEENNPNELDKNILSSLLSQDENSVKHPDHLNIYQLGVAISINRHDVAKEKIFTEGKKWKTEDLIPLATKSISENKVGFVKLFVEKGFFLGKIITVELLENLYTADISNGTKLARILNQGLRLIGFKKNNKRVSLYDIGGVLKYLLGDLYYPLYLNPEFQETWSSNLPLKRPYRELFIWSLLTLRMEMAQLLWTLEKESIAAALFAANLLRSMKNLTNVISDKDDLDEWAKDFETKAEGVVEECFKENPEFTRDNLIRQLDYYGRSTYLEMAADGNSIKFIAHRSCQELLDFVWRGTLDDTTKSMNFIMYLIIGVICPFMIPFIVNFKSLFYLPESEIVEYKKKLKNKQKISTRQCSESEKKDSNTKKIPRKRNFTFQLKTYFKKMYDFYNAPVIKFSYTIFFYLIFILYFTFLNLTAYHIKYSKNSNLWIYILLIFWTVSLLIEEARQAFGSGISIKEYLNDIWNIIDILSHSFFLLGTFGIIMTLSDPLVKSLLFSLFDITPMVSISVNLLRFSKFMYGFSIFLFTVRILQYFSINVKLGPIIVMIRNMLTNDLGPFIVILLTVLVSYGILLGSINFEVKPNLTMSEFSMILYEMFLTGYFQLFGNLRIDVLRGENNLRQCANNNLMCPDVWGVWLGPIIAAVYMVLSNVLMLNLLVAIFSNTYEIIQSSSTQYWTLERYQLMRQSSSRPPVAPPLIIFWQIYFVFARLITIKVGQKQPFKISYSSLPYKEKQLIQWERMRANDYIRSFDEQSKSKRNKTTLIVNRGPAAIGSIGGMKKDFESTKNEILQSFTERISIVEFRLQKMDIIEENVNTIYDILRKLGPNLPLNNEIKISKKNELMIEPAKKIEVTSMLENTDYLPPGIVKKTLKLWKSKFVDHLICRFVPIFTAEQPVEFIEDDSKESQNEVLTEDLIEFPNGIPINPHETLNKIGKPLLPFWGVNSCIHLLISRWKPWEKDDENDIYKSILQVLGIGTTNHIELPFIIVQHNTECEQNLCSSSKLEQIIRDYFIEINKKKADNKTFLNEKEFESLNNSKYDKVYEGYLKDFRNSDNSWIETSAFNIHLEDNLEFTKPILHMLQHDDSETLCWVDVDKSHWTNPSNIILLSFLSNFHGFEF